MDNTYNEIDQTLFDFEHEEDANFINNDNQKGRLDSSQDEEGEMKRKMSQNQHQAATQLNRYSTNELEKLPDLNLNAENELKDIRGDDEENDWPPVNSYILGCDDKSSYVLWFSLINAHIQ